MATPSVTYTFAPHTLIKASEANTNFQDIIDFLTNEVIQKDASTAFTVTPSGPSLDPTTDDQFARKKYVDDKIADKIAAEAPKRGKISGSLDNALRADHTFSVPAGVASSWVFLCSVSTSISGGLIVNHTVTSGGQATVIVRTPDGVRRSGNYTINWLALPSS